MKPGQLIKFIAVLIAEDTLTEVTEVGKVYF
jgi:hypothetical protein